MIRRNCFLFGEDQERWVHGGGPDSKGFGLALIQILVASLMPWLSYFTYLLDSVSSSGT